MKRLKPDVETARRRSNVGCKQRSSPSPRKKVDVAGITLIEAFSLRIIFVCKTDCAWRWSDVNNLVEQSQSHLLAMPTFVIHFLTFTLSKDSSVWLDRDSPANTRILSSLGWITPVPHATPQGLGQPWTLQMDLTWATSEAYWEEEKRCHGLEMS